MTVPESSARPHPACRGGGGVRNQNVGLARAAPHPARRGGGGVRSQIAVRAPASHLRRWSTARRSRALLAKTWPPPRQAGWEPQGAGPAGLETNLASTPASGGGGNGGRTKIYGNGTHHDLAFNRPQSLQHVFYPQPGLVPDRLGR